MKPRKFEVVKGTSDVHIGATVYDAMTCDYGITAQDSVLTGIEHSWVTFNEDGSGPGFTFPKLNLNELHVA